MTRLVGIGSPPKLDTAPPLPHAPRAPDAHRGGKLGGTGMKVGFIGVGNMGGPMCRNIIRNTNHEVVVFDLSPDAITACTELGASAGTSVADVAARCEVVITSLPLPRVVEEVALGAGGIAANAKPGTVYHRSVHQRPRHRAPPGRRHAGQGHRDAGGAGLRRHRARQGRHHRHHGRRRRGGVRGATAAAEVVQRRGDPSGRDRLSAPPPS